MVDRDQVLVWGLGALLGASAVVHVVRPQFFDAIVPEALPGPARFWTYASGITEGATAALVLNPSTRRSGGFVSAALFVAVFPANIKYALDSRTMSTTTQVLAYLRLPLQIPLVLWGLRVAALRRSPRG